MSDDEIDLREVYGTRDDAPAETVVRAPQPMIDWWVCLAGLLPVLASGRWAWIWLLPSLGIGIYCALRMMDAVGWRRAAWLALGIAYAAAGLSCLGRAVGQAIA